MSQGKFDHQRLINIFTTDEVEVCLIDRRLRYYI